MITQSRFVISRIRNVLFFAYPASKQTPQIHPAFAIQVFKVPSVHASQRWNARSFLHLLLRYPVVFRNIKDHWLIKETRIESKRFMCRAGTRVSKL